jgi:sugar/nucleoside kinase (ribokinase family)
MSVLVVGSVAIDDIETPFGSADGVLGGSASYFALAASHFAPVDVVAVIGDDFPEEHLDRLRVRGIRTDAVERRRGESFRWSGSYSGELKTASTRETRLGVFETFDPVLDPVARASRHVFLANIDPVLQRRVLDQISEPELTVLDTMNFWIEKKRSALIQVLARVDVVLLNDEELRLLTHEPNLVRASRSILDLGPRAVVVKKGEHGVFLRTPDDFFAMPAFPTEDVHDPTGAGDSFAGGFVGYLSAAGSRDGEVWRRAVARGVVMASFAVEAFSVERLHGLSRGEIESRLRALHRLTEFSV